MFTCNANMSRFRGYKIRIYPTEEQKEEIDKTINTCRAIYNIALDYQEKVYANEKKYIGYYDMCKIFSDIRKNDPNYYWFNDIPMSTIRQVLVNLNMAYKMFFNKILPHPKFKSKRFSKKSFCLRSDRVYVRDQYIGIPGIGNVYAKSHPLKIGERVYNASITFDGYNYWFSCQKEKPIIVCEKRKEPMGIDVGIRNMITTSDGDYYHFSDTSKHEKRLRRQQRRLQKYYNRYIAESMRTKTKYEDIPKSKNMLKKLAKQRKTYNKITNKRHNDIHVATKRIVEKLPSSIVIEDIRVSKLLKENSYMRKYTKQACFSLILNTLKYKAEDRGIPVIVAKHKFASSQICSNCGNVKKVYHSKYICPKCGLHIDRDLNAALNLRNLAYQPNSEYIV